MSDRDDQSIDHELHGIARAAVYEHEQTVSGGETRAALGAVRSRLAAGDLGGAPPSIDLARARRRRSPLILLGAAAAVTGMIALGLVAVIGGERTNDVIVPATVPATDSPSTVPTPSGPVTTDADTEGVTTVPSAPEFVEQTITIDAANPPDAIEPTVWRTVPIDPANPESVATVAIGEDAVLVKQKGVQAVTVLDRTGEGRSEIALAEDVGAITAGPFGTLYGLGGPEFSDDGQAAPTALRFVGISLTDDGPAPAGEVFAVAEVEVNRFLELPPYPFGTGDTGVIDRSRVVGDTIIEFSEGRDSTVGALGVPVPQFDENDAGFADPTSGRIVIPDRGRAWNLDIIRDPANGSDFDGPSAPAPTTRDRIIHFERIGAAESEADFARNAMPVVAILEPDGSGRWIRLPDDWNVVASDVWGTVLMRTTATDFEIALLDDALADGDGSDSPTTSAPSGEDGASALTQPTAIPRVCASEFECTQLAVSETGRIVAFDPGGASLQVYDPTGTELQADVSLTESLTGDRAQLVHIGPDDVAYLVTPTPGSLDPGNDLLAIPLDGPRAGSVVMRRTGIAGSGDSVLIPSKSGLTDVGCCGPKVTRPVPDAPVYPWVDRNGEIVESTAPSFELDLGSAGNRLTRIDTAADGAPTFTRLVLPTVFAHPRDFPVVVATDDGGALAHDLVQLQSAAIEVFVDFDLDWPDGDVDNGDVYYREYDEVSIGLLLEPTGSVIVGGGPDGGEFVRRSPDQIATRGWTGRVVVDPETATASAPGLDDHIEAEQPFWARTPDLFALQLAPATVDSAETQIEFDDAESPVVTITTTGLPDDSVEATRLVVSTERADDGLLRFVGATYGFRCVPGRGHQDFSTEPCI